jgi:leader peptidase (prepilin peptidase)/N-methyltransferase
VAPEPGNSYGEAKVLERFEPLVSVPAAYVFVGLLGVLWGSFANVCIYRWPPTEEFPRGRSVVAPGSHCTTCKVPIRWYDNVPVLAWLWLRGRCRSCGAEFSARYLIVEAVTGALFVVAWWAAVVAPQWFEPFDARLLHFLVYAAFCFVMVVITFIDLDHKLILNKITIPSIAVFYAASFLWPEHRWYDGVVGAAVGYGLPWAIAEVYYRVTRREGMGLGDGMLLALVGALLGWRGVLVALFGGSLIGSVIGVTALALGRARGADEQDEPEVPPTEAPSAMRDPGDPAGAAPPSLMRTELPFGPFLAIAAMFYLFAEPWIQMQFHLPGG